MSCLEGQTELRYRPLRRHGRVPFCHIRFSPSSCWRHGRNNCMKMIVICRCGHGFELAAVIHNVEVRGKISTESNYEPHFGTGFLQSWKAI